MSSWLLMGLPGVALFGLIGGEGTFAEGSGQLQDWFRSLFKLADCSKTTQNLFRTY